VSDDKNNGNDEDNVVPFRRPTQSQVDEIKKRAEGKASGDNDMIMWEIKRLSSGESEVYVGILSVSGDHYAVVDEEGVLVFVCPPSSVDYVRRVYDIPEDIQKFFAEFESLDEDG